MKANNKFNRVKFIDRMTVIEPPDAVPFISNPGCRLSWVDDPVNGFTKTLNESEAKPDGRVRPWYEETETEVIRHWEAVQVITRYSTKKIIEKMIAQNLLAVIRDALIAINMYEIMLLEPFLSTDDPRFITVLEVVAPIASSNGIYDVTAWLEDCKLNAGGVR